MKRADVQVAPGFGLVVDLIDRLQPPPASPSGRARPRASRSWRPNKPLQRYVTGGTSRRSNAINLRLF